jgi:hypothetical protein
LPIFLPKARPKAPVNPIKAENCSLLLVQFAYFGCPLLLSDSRIEMLQYIKEKRRQFN